MTGRYVYGAIFAIFGYIGWVGIYRGEPHRLPNTETATDLIAHNARISMVFGVGLVVALIAKAGGDGPGSLLVRTGVMALALVAVVFFGLDTAVAAWLEAREATR